MKAVKPLIGLGIVVLVSGIIFSLQGRSVVGPESSFMYSNPEWISYGQWIAIIGIIIMAAGMVISKKASLRHPK